MRRKFSSCLDSPWSVTACVCTHTGVMGLLPWLRELLGAEVMPIIKKIRLGLCPCICECLISIQEALLAAGCRNIHCMPNL